MENVVVRKEDLILKLEDNRTKHMALYDEAVIVFRRRLEEELTKRLEQLRRGDKIDLTIRLPVPEQHMADFDAALAMLSWSIDDEIEISDHDFRRYVLNDWDWMRSFTSNTAAYTVGAVIA